MGDETCEDVCVMTHRLPPPAGDPSVQCTGAREVLVVFAGTVTATGRSRMCRPCAEHLQRRGKVERVEDLP